MSSMFDSRHSVTGSLARNHEVGNQRWSATDTVGIGPDRFVDPDSTAVSDSFEALRYSLGCIPLNRNLPVP